MALSTTQQIEQRLTDALAPSELAVKDESEQHRGHAGQKEGVSTHFHVRVVSERFAGLNRVARQRLVYAALADLMEKPIHALALETKAPGE
jgi:BolA family transcriptional regulator, general stress-responsive regulator